MRHSCWPLLIAWLLVAVVLPTAGQALDRAQDTGPVLESSNRTKSADQVLLQDAVKLSPGTAVRSGDGYCPFIPGFQAARGDPCPTPRREFPPILDPAQQYLYNVRGPRPAVYGAVEEWPMFASEIVNQRALLAGDERGDAAWWGGKAGHDIADVQCGSQEHDVQCGAEHYVPASYRRMLADDATPRVVLVYTPPNNTFLETSTSMDFSNFLFTALANKTVAGIRIKPGSYYVVSNTSSTSAMNLPCGLVQRPFFIDMSGVTLTVTSYLKGIMSLSNCTGLVMTGPSEVYYRDDQIPFTQGTVTGISPDGNTLTVQIHAGYPTDTIMNYSSIALLAHDRKTRTVKHNTSDMYVYKTPVKLDNRTYRISLPGPGYNLEVGDLFAVRGPCTWCHGFYLYNNTGCTWRDIMIHMSPSFGIFSTGGTGGSTFINITIVPSQRPVGPDLQTPLYSSTADAIHVKWVKEGPKIINCTIASSGDDAIAIHGVYNLVVSVDAAKRSVTLAFGADIFPTVGDELSLYDGLGYLVGSATVVKSDLIPRPVMTFPKTNILRIDLTKATFRTLYLNAWPTGFMPLQKGANNTVASSPQYNGNGYLVEGNEISDLRGRGLLLKGSNGHVSGNAITGTVFWAIQVMPELYWAEADFMSNVTIENNVIESPAGGIVVGMVLDNGTFSSAQNIEDIVIQNNQISGINNPGFLMASGAFVTFIDNTISDAYCSPFVIAVKDAYKGVPAGALVFLTQSADILVANNTFLNQAGCRYGNYSNQVMYSKSVSNLTMVSGFALS